MTKKTFLAGLAASALILTACGGDTEPATAPTTTAVVESSAAAPAEETTSPVETTTGATTEATPEETTDAPAEPVGGDFPFEEGPVEPLAFAEAVTAGLEGTKNMLTTTSQAGGVSSETLMDISDRANPISYSTTTMGDSTLELVSDNKGIHSRTDGGEWEYQPHDQATLDLIESQGDTTTPEFMAQSYQSIELVDAETKQFEVVMDLAAAMGGTAEPGQGIPATVYLDDRNRVIKQEISMGEISVTNEMEYDVADTIPEVPAVN